MPQLNTRKTKGFKKTKKSNCKGGLCKGYPNRSLYKNHSQEATLSLSSDDYLVYTEQKPSCHDPHPSRFLGPTSWDEVDQEDVIIISYKELHDTIDSDAPICSPSCKSASAACLNQDSECHLHIDTLSQKVTATDERVLKCFSSRDDEDRQDTSCIFISYDELQNSDVYKNETSISKDPLVITIDYDELKDSFTFKSKQGVSKDFPMVTISHDELQNIIVFKNEKENLLDVFTNAHAFTPRVTLEEDVEFDDQMIKEMPNSASMSISSQTIGDFSSEVPSSSSCVHEINDIDIENKALEEKRNGLQPCGKNPWNDGENNTNGSYDSSHDLSEKDNESLPLSSSLQNRFTHEYFESWPFIKKRGKPDEIKTGKEASKLNSNPMGKDNSKFWIEFAKFNESKQGKRDGENKEQLIYMKSKPSKSSSNHVNHQRHAWEQQKCCSSIKCNCLEPNLEGIKGCSLNEMYDHYGDGHEQDYWPISSDRNQTPWNICLNVYDINDSSVTGSSTCLKSEDASNSNDDSYIQEKVNQNMNESHTELTTQQNRACKLSSVKYLSNFRSWGRTSSLKGTCIPCKVHDEHFSKDQERTDGLRTENMANNLIEYNATLFLPDYNMQIAQANGETLHIEIIPILIYTENGIPVFLTPTYFE